MRLRAIGALWLAGGLALLCTATALAHGGNPDYRSELRAIQPPIDGLDAEVLNYDDRLQLINRTGETVLILGYDREPYARLKGDGTVEVNRRSPSGFLNDERYGGTQVPPSADSKAPPQWSVVSKTGRFEWHDHRIHWMSKDSRPPAVKDEDKRTKVFDWDVPVRVGSRTARLRGTLFWAPAGAGGIPTAAVVALVVLVALTATLYLVTRRVRAKPSRKSAEAF